MLLTCTTGSHRLVYEDGGAKLRRLLCVAPPRLRGAVLGQDGVREHLHHAAGLAHAGDAAEEDDLDVLALAGLQHLVHLEEQQVVGLGLRALEVARQRV